MNRGAQGTLAVMAFSLIGMPAHAAVIMDGANAFVRGAVVISSKSPRAKEDQAGSDLVDGAATVVASVTVTDKDKQGDKASDREAAGASFDSPSSGVFEFAGKTKVSVASNPDTLAEAYNSGSSVNYDFTLTSSYLFDVNYGLEETSGSYYDNYFQVISLSGGPPIISGNPADGSLASPTFGSDSVILGPGTYEFGATSKLGDLIGVEGPGKAKGIHFEEYEFSLTAVPEPGSWLMMIAGFAVVGFSLRRRARSVGVRYA